MNRFRRFHWLLAAVVFAWSACARMSTAADLVSDLPTCDAANPWDVWLAFESSDTDCTDDLTNSGTTIAKCCCLNGTVYACKGSGSGGGGSIILDLGDDSGNDSTALAEIATTGDDYSVVTEPSADKALLNVGKVAPYRQWDPDRPPSTCAACDDWTGDTAALTWEWGNQDSASESITKDVVILSGDTAADELHVRWTDPPAGANNDLTITARMYIETEGNTSGCGIIILHGGTVATPTDLTFVSFIDAASDAVYFQSDADYNPAAGTTTHGSSGLTTEWPYRRPIILQLRYTDSTRATTAWASWNDYVYGQISGSKTLTNDPIKIGYYARKGAECTLLWWRARTDAGRNDASD